MIFDTLIELNFLNNYNFLIKKKKKNSMLKLLKTIIKNRISLEKNVTTFEKLQQFEIEIFKNLFSKY